MPAGWIDELENRANQQEKKEAKEHIISQSNRSEKSYDITLLMKWFDLRTQPKTNLSLRSTWSMYYHLISPHSFDIHLVSIHLSNDNVSNNSLSSLLMLFFSRFDKIVLRYIVLLITAYRIAIFNILFH